MEPESKASVPPTVVKLMRSSAADVCLPPAACDTTLPAVKAVTLLIDQVLDASESVRTMCPYRIDAAVNAPPASRMKPAESDAVEVMPELDVAAPPR